MTVAVWPFTVIVADRLLVRAFAAALRTTVPAPAPPAPEVIVSHDALLVALHVQLAAVLTARFSIPPAGGTDWVVGVTPKVQASDAAWATVTVCPAIVNVPVRLAADAFAAAEKVAVPLPVPVAPPVIVSHPALLIAFHAQPEPPDTVTLPLPPVAGSVNVVGVAA